MRKVTILSFSPIHRDARVIRQIEYLTKQFDVTVIGYGRLPEGSKAKMFSLSSTHKQGFVQKSYARTLLLTGKTLFRQSYEAWYWNGKQHQEAMAYVWKSKPDIIHANDWTALPIAVKTAQKNGTRIVLDLHEFAPLEQEDNLRWRFFFKPMIDYFLKNYASLATASITVNQTIAQRYALEYNLKPIVVMNIPDHNRLSHFKPTNPQQIHLIHHGGAQRNRKQELMIQTIAQSNPCYNLHFMLIDSDTNYILQLKEMAQKIAPGRVFFHSPVPPTAIVHSLSEFDMGFYLLPFTNFNNSVALPNKFFDFIAAGLAVCIGPSPEMALLTRKFGFGVVTDSFNPIAVAKVLNNLDSTMIDNMKQNAIKAQKALNITTEMNKLLNLYAELN